MQLMFILVCFAGLAFMFFCIQRAQERLLTLMQDEHAQIRAILRGLETRMDMVEEEALGIPPENASRDNTEPDFPLQPGATVAQASEMLRAAEGFRSLDLEADKDRQRVTRRMPELKL